MKTETLSIKQFTHPLSLQLTSFHHQDPQSAQRPDTRPHRHSYYEILFFKEASGLIHHMDTTPYQITSGYLFFIAPRQVHFLTRTMPSYKFLIYAITFSDDFLAKITAEAGYGEIINKLLTHPGPMYIHQGKTAYELLWHQMQDEINEKRIGFESYIINQFRNLLIYLKREGQNCDPRMPNTTKERVFYAFQH